MIVKELFARLGVKVDDASVQKGESAFNKVKQAAIAVAGILVAGKVAKGFANIAFSAAEAGDNIAKTSKQIGVNAQALQELQFAAQLAGASQSDLTTGLRLLQKNALEASQGTKSFVEDFKALGVRVTDSSGKLKSAEVLFSEVSEGIRGLESATERTALAQTLLGRSGTKLIPLLNQGSAAIAEQRAEAQALGGVFSTELLGQSEALVDSQLRYRTAINGVRNVLAAVLIPTFTKVLNAMAQIVAAVGRFIKGTKLFQLVLLTFGAVVGSIALILIAKLVAALASVATVAIGATGAISGMGTAALIAQAKALLLGAAFLLLLGILVLIGDEILTAIEGGDTLGKRLGEVLSDLLDDFMELSSANPVVQTLIELFQALATVAITVKNAIFGLIEGLTKGNFTGIFDAIFPETKLGQELKKRVEFGIGGARELLGGAGELLGIGGTTATRSPSAITGGARNQSVSVGEITVNATEGQSALDVANEVKSAVVSLLDDRDREDEQILIPAQAGAVR